MEALEQLERKKRLQQQKQRQNPPAPQEEMEEELEFPRFIPLNQAKSVFDQDDNRKFGGINTAPSLFDQQAAIHTGR